MSLVAYGGDSDSDSSENEAGAEASGETFHSSLNATQSQLNSNELVGHISDEEEFAGVSSTSVSAYLAGSSNSSAHGWKKSSNELINSTTISSLDDLPAPQSRQGAALTVEDALEDEVKPKAAEIASAPKPPGKKTKQTVKITIPSLDMTPEEESSSSKKNVSSSNSKGLKGLFSLLPAPMHSAKKEINRPLIPHTLTKKTAAKKIANPFSTQSLSSASSSSHVASSSDISLKRMSQFNALTGYESDSDDDEGAKTGDNPVSFFSLGQSDSNQNDTIDTTNSTPSVSRLQSEEVSSSKIDATKLSSYPELPDANQQGHTSSPGGSRTEELEESHPEPLPEPGALNDTPLQFGGQSRLRAWATSSVATSSQSFLTPVGLAGPVASSYHSQYEMPSNSEYNMAAYQNMEDSAIEIDTGEVPIEDLKQFMSDKEFRKLQGKRKRGLEESVNFVNANVDDYTDPTEYNKHLTEETEYVSHKNKDNLPTAQQKKKKQITYLAHQAKEKEMELKNQWAMNRQSKMQSQSKYGF